ncbi:MAG: serine/threonine-protein kinase [Pirellulaceae bacterium]
MNKVPDYVRVLLTASEDSAEFAAAAKQLDQNPEHYPLLEQFAVEDQSWWEETRETLADSGVPDTNSEASSVLVEMDPSRIAGEGDEGTLPHCDVESLSLDFLQAPPHPELLGRFGRYEVERVVGTGGMGVVLRAYDSELHRVVAIKVLAAHLAHNSTARRRFAREAQAAAAVVHPNVIQIHDVDSDSKVPHLVMQYVAGESLQKRVQRQGPLTVLETMRIALQTAAALEAAHGQSLVHRDVKPANILLEEKVGRVLLSDFGLARAVDDSSLTRTGIVAGTPHYMSPEQALGQPVDHRSDLFSLGCVMYFMLTGRPPFRAEGAMAVLNRICNHEPRRIQELNPEVPMELAELVESCLAKDTGSRVSDASELQAELKRLLAAYEAGELRFSMLVASKKPPQPTGLKALVQLAKTKLQSRSFLPFAAVIAVGLLVAVAPAVLRSFNSDPSNMDAAATSRSGFDGGGGETSVFAELRELTSVEEQFQQTLKQAELEIRQLMSEDSSYVSPDDGFGWQASEIQAEIESLKQDLP